MALLGVAALALGVLALLPGPQPEVLLQASAGTSLPAPEPAPVRPVATPHRPVPPAKQAAKPRPRPPAQRVSRSTRVSGAAGYACPVDGPHHFTDDWGAPRVGHRHQGTDVLAPYGARVVAVTSGVIRTTYSTFGGISLYLRGTDGTEYFYAHNSRNVAGNGQRVVAGQLIAYVGNSGDARGGPSHVHFERHPGGGAAVDPYPFLLRVC